MNKKLKIVSSIALAGMLVTSSFGVGKVFADSTSDYITNPVGIYNKLVQGKSVVPYVLANKDDKLTVKDVTDSDLFKGNVSTIDGTAVTDQSKLVGTGDVIKTTDGKEYTVVLYGDVDDNGTVTGMDALRLLDANANNITLTDVEREAADVKNDGNLNSLDALAVQEFVVGLNDSVINKLPEAEEEVVDSNYTFSIKDAEYVNSVNEEKVTLKIDLDEVLTEKEETPFKLVISDEDDATADVEATVNIEKNLVSVETGEINLSSLSDGTITVTMEDEEKNVVGQYKMEKNTVTPVATNVNTNRTGTRTATLSLEKCGESGITTVKYVVKRLTDPADSAPTKVEELTNTINASNGKVENAQIADNLDTKVAYTVYYVLENEYGSQSEIESVIIASDDNSVKAEEALKEVVAPVLSETSTAVFSWDEDEKYDSSKTYIATLYKDGEAKEVKEVTGSGEVDFTAEMKENGTYKVSVVVKGNAQGTSTNSPATESKEVTVSTLASVTDVKIENVDNVIELSWNNPNGKEEFKEYSISLYSINDKGEEVLVADDIACENDKNKVDITSEIDVNTIYVAKVNVVALDGQMEKLSPEEVTSNQFYLVEAPMMDSAVRGTESITFEIEPITIANKAVQYKVEVYDVDTTWNNDYDRPKYTLKTTKNVTVNNENKITIDGLNSLDTYAFKLVAVVDGNEVKSAYSDEIQTLPEINNITVGTVEEASKENSSKIAADDTKLYINGVSYDTTTGNIVELDSARKIVKNLKSGDVVTINEDASNVEIKLGGTADNEARDFGDTDFVKSTVVLENNNFNKTISGTFKSLTLKGEGTIFDVSGITIADENEGELVITDGVEVSGDNYYTVESNAEVIINKVKVSTSDEMKLVAEGKNLAVVVENGVTNNVVFVNETDGDAVIAFVGDDTFTAEQAGTITIKSVGGKVTVESTNVNVSADIKVEVNKGTVNIQNPALTGNKEVSVSADEKNPATVEAISKAKAPITMNNVELKAYTDEEMKTVFGSSITQADMIAIREYIDAFGLNGTGAKITVTKGSTEVKLVINSNVDKIENLK